MTEEPFSEPQPSFNGEFIRKHHFSQLFSAPCHRRTSGWLAARHRSPLPQASRNRTSSVSALALVQLGSFVVRVVQPLSRQPGQRINVR